jgi:hypothetical protein
VPCAPAFCFQDANLVDRVLPVRALSFFPPPPPTRDGHSQCDPDSFSDGGQHATRDAALRHAEQLIAEGVDIIDIGGSPAGPGRPRCRSIRN